MQKRAGFTDPENASSDWFASPIRFTRKLLEAAGRPSNYNRMSVHNFKASRPKAFPGEKL